jgi:iron complex outermembrane recepter protein
MRIRSLPLMVLVGLFLCWAGPAGAQTPAPSPTPPPSEATPPADTGQPVTEEITVVGLAEALQAGAEIKRAAPAIVDAVVASDINKLPDKNLAEAVQRVPGVVINREFGEGERVSLRGVGANLVRTSVNGHNVAVADWFVLEQLAATRSFNYLLLPSEIIGMLKVYKSPTADIDEGGIGGTIDVQTRKPLDQKPFTIAVSLQDAYTENSESNDPNASATLTWTDAAKDFGVLFSGVYDKRNIRRDGVEVLGYFNGPGGLLMPSLIGSALFEQERERKSFNATAQWRPTDQLEIILDGLYSKFGADNINQNYLAWGSQAIGGGGTLTNATVHGDTAVAGTVTSVNGGTGGRGVVFDAIDRFALAKTNYIDLAANYTAADSWLLHFDVGNSKAEGDTQSQPFVEFGAPGAFRYDLRGDTPQVTFLGVDPTRPNDMAFDFASLHEITNDDSELYSYLDAEKIFDGGAFKSLKFGVKYTDHERKTDFQATTYGGFFLPLSATGCNGHACNPSDFAGGTTPNDFLGSASSGTLNRYWSVNRGLVERYLFGSFNGQRIPNPPAVFSVEETTYGGFVMGNLELGKWKGNVGLRAVHTDQDSEGNEVSSAGEISNAFGNFSHVKVSRSYDDYLPSVNFSRDINADLVLRLAAARTMTRPDFTDVSPGVTLNEGALTGQGGNPNVDPYRANQLDVSLERYHGKASLSAAVFYKDIKSFITDHPVQQAHLIQTDNPNTSLCTPAFTAEFPNRYSCLFTINQRTNGGGGTVAGVELAALQPIWGGFGVQANYTYSDANADDDQLEIPGNSKHSGNLVLYYEVPRWQGRLAYNYRSEFFVTFDRSTQLNQESLQSLDASFSINLVHNLAFTLDGVNLTDEKVVQFASDTFRPRAWYDNGRYYFVGFRWKND